MPPFFGQHDAFEPCWNFSLIKSLLLKCHCDLPEKVWGLFKIHISICMSNRMTFWVTWSCHQHTFQKIKRADWEQSVTLILQLCCQYIQVKGKRMFLLWISWSVTEKLRHVRILQCFCTEASERSGVQAAVRDGGHLMAVACRAAGLGFLRLRRTEALSPCECVEGYWGRGAPATDGCVWEDSNRLPLGKKRKEKKTRLWAVVKINKLINSEASWHTPPVWYVWKESRSPHPRPHPSLWLLMLLFCLVLHDERCDCVGLFGGFLFAFFFPEGEHWAERFRSRPGLSRPADASN